MTAVLPRGLINANPDAQSHVLDNSVTSYTNSEAVRKFWRVYAVQSEATQDANATRARNLFWRVWSSPALTSSITSARLTRLWQQCSQEFDLTPIGGCRSASPFPSMQHDFPSPKQLRNRSSSMSPSAEVRAASDSSPPHGQNIDSTFQDFRWTATSEHSRAESSRLPFRSAAEGSGQKSNNTSSSASQNTSDTSSRPTLSRTASGGRQRLPVVATAGKARTRPTIPRRKSSSQKPVGSSGQPKSPRGQTDTPTVEASSDVARNERLAARGPPPGLPMPAAVSESAFVLPSASSWQSDESASPQRPMATTLPAESTMSRDLVEPDFRGKFVENQRKLNSSTNLAGLGRIRRPGSVVRFADELPREELSKGKERDAPTSPLREENLGSSRLRTSMSSAAIADDSDSDSSTGGQLELPRTKSQLSLLINTKRIETGNAGLGPPAQPQTSKGKEKEAHALEKTQSKEEELLSMGRRDGVTKAGGVQVPRQQRVNELDEAGYHSPSSPEPIF